MMTLRELEDIRHNQEYFLLLNVLSEESYRRGHIPGSFSVPLATPEFLQKVTELAGAEGKNRRIVTYSSGCRCNASTRAANRLLQSGYRHVTAFVGGIEEWISAGHPVSGDASKPYEIWYRGSTASSLTRRA